MGFKTSSGTPLCFVFGYSHFEQNNIPFSIFDREMSANYGSREWTMSVHWGVPLIESLLPVSLYQKLESAQSDPNFKSSASDTLNIYNAQTGELLKELPTGGLRPFSRRKLRHLCATDLEVGYGKTLDQIVYNEDGTSVTAIFSDNTQATGTILVGADGSRSKTRELILGPDLSRVKQSGFVLLSSHTSYSAEQATRLRYSGGTLSIAFHPNGTTYYTIPQDLASSDPEQWIFRIMHSSAPRSLLSGSSSERLSYLKSQSPNVVEPFRSAFEQIPEGTAVSCDDLVYWEPVAFDAHHGRVTLAGDAAHPMTPQRGQGLNHAICDVANLLKQFCEVRDGIKGLEEAVESYATEMVSRGSEEVKAALLVSIPLSFISVKFTFWCQKFQINPGEALAIGSYR